MQLSELIRQLTNIAEDLNPSGDLFAECDPEVMGATQPTRPLQFDIDDVVALDPVLVFHEEFGYEPPEGEDAERWHEELALANDADRTVYLGEGPHQGYLEPQAKELLGW